MPIIEVVHDNQMLNFDFVIRNRGASALRLKQITMTAYDSAHNPILIRKINGNGFPSSLETIPNRNLRAQGTVGIFNPLYAFPRNADINSLRYDFEFATTSGRKDVSSIVWPFKYEDKTPLEMPLKGRLLVIDGHDFYAHHRRQDLSNPEAAKAGIVANPVRYAVDLVFADPSGQMYSGDPRDKKNWFGYGQPVYAPSSGRVIAVVNDVGEASWDGRDLHVPTLPADASPFGMGNYVEIDHGNAEVSFLAHLVPGSISVKPGDQVKGGDVVGNLGTSDAGDTSYSVEPHLHYMLMNGEVLTTAEGLPAYFGHFRRTHGIASTGMERESLDTGDIVDAE